MDRKQSNSLTFKVKNKFDQNFKLKRNQLLEGESLIIGISDREKIKYFRKNAPKLLSSAEDSSESEKESDTQNKYERLKGRNNNKNKIKIKI